MRKLRSFELCANSMQSWTTVGAVMACTAWEKKKKEKKTRLRPLPGSTPPQCQSRSVWCGYSWMVALRRSSPFATCEGDKSSIPLSLSAFFSSALVLEEVEFKSVTQCALNEWLTEVDAELGVDSLHFRRILTSCNVPWSLLRSNWRC